MPGGRGTILDIAGALNDDEHSEIASAVKMAIDTGYRIQGTSVPLIGAAYAKCEHITDLAEIWCYASEKGAVDWVDY